MRRIARASNLGAAALVALIALLAAADGAAAAVRTGTLLIQNPNQPSLGGSVTETQREPIIDSFTVSYDDAVGGVDVRVKLFDPQTWGNNLPATSFSLSRDCDDSGLGTDELLKGSMDGQAGRITRTGFDGAAEGTVSYDGTTFDLSVANPGLAGLNLRCFTLDSTDDGSHEMSYGLGTFFSGYAPMKLTAAKSQAAFSAWLIGKYAARFTSAARTYVKCGNVWTDDDGTQYADCEAEFGTGRHWHAVGWGPTVKPADYRISPPTHVYSRSWTRHWSRNSRACVKSWGVTGTIWSNAGVCDSPLAFHYFRGVAYTGGTGSGAFPKLNVFPCKHLNRRTIQCTNGMGDSMRWRR